MDIIKQELLKKQQSKHQKTGGNKFYNRVEDQNKRHRELREEEKRETEAKALRKKQNGHGGNSSSSSTPNSDPSKSKNDASSSSKTLAVEKKIDDPDLPRQEVIRRLRLLKEPATLYGEDDQMRLERLRHVVKTGQFEINDSDMTEGQTNDFLRDIVEMKKGKSGNRKRKKEDANEDKEDGGDDDLSGEGEDDEDDDRDSKRMKTDFNALCDEDKILVFFKRLLNEWKQELDEMPDAERRTAKGKSHVATFKQCARYLHPLFKFCRKKVLPDDIRRALMLFVDCCTKGEYLAAMDHYIRLAIGNAPWPIGVTMVGIHERSAREKIHTNSVAHIMNDETTRKYLQSVKRLMTFCQRRYPSMPSKSVEFNSLANGSDLQSLLAQGVRKPQDKTDTEEKPRLMPPPKKEE